MAEARSIAMVNMGLAARRSGAVELFTSDQGLTIKITIPKPKMMARSLKRKYHVMRNTLLYSFFPLGILSVIAVVALFIAVVLGSDRSSWWRSGRPATIIWYAACAMPGFELLPLTVQLVGLATTAGLASCLAVMVVQRYVLRMLLNWTGWLYVPRGQKPWRVVAWSMAVKALTVSAKQALTFSLQGSLPRLPVPSLEATTRKYLESIEPLRDEGEMAEERERVEAFLANEGPTLQRYLWLKSLWAPNYVTDWWEKYVYLRGRSPLMINSNYYINDSSMYRPTSSPAARAGDIIEGMLEYMRMIDHETLEIQMVNNTIPLCMEQSRRMFATTRVPGLEHDTLVHLEAGESRHIVVLYRGVFTALPVFYKGHLLDGYQIENQFTCLQEAVDAYIEEHGEPGTAGKIGALTAGNRTRWAEVREEYFSSGVNGRSLEVIERALFFVAMDPAKPANDTDMGRLNLTGRGYDRWFDKSITMVLYANGVMGVNCEHSWADALCPARMVEHAMTRHFNQKVFDENGSVIPRDGFTKRVPYQGTILPWDLPVAAQAAVEDAVLAASALIADVELQLYQHPWGKGRIKGCRLSPDAFVQMAMQLAYYRDQGELCLTYEASTTRLFRNGRTETVRTCSSAVKAFVEAMEDESVPASEVRAALQTAVDGHVLKFKDAMSGRGLDRHLFALYVVSVGRGIESEFLAQAISSEWRLSTSQQPQRQTDNWDPSTNPEHAQRVSSGGGFGPVADTAAYGVSYMLAGEHTIYFHVSSKVSCPLSSSTRFIKNIGRALDDVLALFDEDAQ
ncbi:carnitine O-acyltransferase [Thecamonas trahens ATCC 50062]|uniref:Carnitine O-acyltransferase n=1 Tax=Thecamonas trahens ATCC 50062 TaxID=461836 RepID=A0A0L0DKE5_THETB|nr:carnitine O-acyltransferase [Thecamonas trahens ATCC 50062]KNC52757.1 carnitine O-acyltransferase [Thecamonas trahens ATCC 50062]|eukprot:XP_013755070.1 carnitine O-acyltransferase [Thecamonas trahens ATCC 50062]